MRPWIALGALALGLAVAGVLALPRGEAPAPPRELPLVKTPPQRDVPTGEAASPDHARLEIEPLLEEPEPPGKEITGTPVPGESSPLPEPELLPELTPLVNGAGEPSRFLVRSVLESKITRDHPELETSPEALERATDAILRIRAARLEMAKLPLDTANAPQRVVLQDQIMSALLEFEKALGISPIDFSKPASTQGDSQDGDGEDPSLDPESYDAPPPATGR